MTMMQKPGNWDMTTAITGEYTPLPPGGYECRNTCRLAFNLAVQTYTATQQHIVGSF